MTRPATGRGRSPKDRSGPKGKDTTRHRLGDGHRASDLPQDTDHPAAVYRDSLNRGSYWAVHHALTTIADLLGGGDPWSYPWEELRYADTARVRARLVERYAPATVNKMLTVLRGVLKTCWRLGLVDAETYRRAADVANGRAKTLPAGRALETDEVRALFDSTPVRPTRPPPAAATPLSSPSSTAPACGGPSCAVSTSPTSTLATAR